jgi:hypothetical protein
MKTLKPAMFVTTTLTALSLLSGCGESPSSQTQSQKCDTALTNPNGQRVSLSDLLKNTKGTYTLQEARFIGKGEEQTEKGPMKANVNAGFKTNADTSETEFFNCFEIVGGMAMNEPAKFEIPVPARFESGNGRIHEVLNLIIQKGSTTSARKIDQSFTIESFLRSATDSNSDSSSLGDLQFIKGKQNTYYLIFENSENDETSRSHTRLLLKYQFEPMEVNPSETDSEPGTEEPTPKPVPQRPTTGTPPTTIPTPAPTPVATVPTPSPVPTAPQFPTEPQIANRCGMNRDHVTIDGEKSFFFFNDRDRLNAYKKLVQSGLCTKKSRIGVKNNHITIDQKPAFYFYEDTDRMDAFMTLMQLNQQSFPACAVSGQSITLNGNQAASFYEDKDRMEAFIDMAKNDLCR